MRFIRIISAVITMFLVVSVTGCEGDENTTTEIIRSDPNVTATYEVSSRPTGPTTSTDSPLQSRDSNGSIDTYASTDNSASTYGDTYASTYADTFFSTYADTYASTGTYSSTDTYTTAETDTGTFVDIDPERFSIPAQMSNYAMEEPIYVQGDQLTMDSQSPQPKGEIELNFIDYEIKTAIKARLAEKGMIEAQGNFLILYYFLLNELNTDIQPATMINDQLYLTDDKGRHWIAADALETYDQISDDAAVEMGFNPPGLGIGSGLDDVTAIVFDIPTDAGNLKVVWEEVGVSIALD